MPLWLQGALETAQAAIISALAVLAPIIAVWATAGFQDDGFETLARLAGQSWLLVHGVPLELAAGRIHRRSPNRLRPADAGARWA